MDQRTTTLRITADSARSRALVSVLLFILVSSFSFVVAAQTSDSQSDGQLVESANSLLKDGKLDDAWKTANEAIQAQSTNYLAYVVGAKIASRRGDASQATTLVNKALDLAPAEAKDKIRELAAMLAPNASATDVSAPALSDDDQLKHDGLMRIVEKASKASDADERKNLFRKFLTQSVEFADAHPELADLWVARAYAAVELDYPGEGWLAGKRLKALRATRHDDPKIREELVELESEGWLGDARKWREWSKWTTDQVNAAAEEGDAEAQFALGADYFNGKNGLVRDYGEAAKWNRRAAEQGNTVAQRNLAVQYINGLGVEKDYTEAIEWLRKAADQGDADSEETLAEMYEKGWGVDKDYSQALHWYRKSADQNNPQSENGLGAMYANGRGVDKDLGQAFNWIRKAAGQGNSEAEKNLGALYEHGLGVEKSVSDALTWYRKAADQGELDAQKALERLNEAQEQGSASGQSANSAKTPDPNDGSEYDSLDGVEVGDIDVAARQQYGLPIKTSGAVVTAVSGNSNSAEAGLQVGDVIQEINRHTVRSADDAVKWSNNAHSSTVLLRVWRSSEGKGSSFYITVDNKKKHAPI